MAVKGSATPIALTIAGSDSSGGAGIQADLKTFSAFGVYGASVLTALTAQNTRGVDAVFPVPPDFVAAQLRSILSDLEVGALKTGMLANAGVIDAVAEGLRDARHIPIVCDPVMVATSGDALLDPAAVGALRNLLLPSVALLTPNLPEAARLLETGVAGDEDAMIAQAKALRGLGCAAVLLKGGHRTADTALDILVTPEGVTRLEAPRVATEHTHGTGCTLAAAVTALLATGVPMEDAVRRAKLFVWRAIEAGANLGVGRGHGPVDHLYAVRSQPPPA